MSDEEWIPAVGFDGRYLVSRDGKIKSTCEYELIKFYHYPNSIWVGLMRNGRRDRYHLGRLVKESLEAPTKPKFSLNLGWNITKGK